MAEGPYMTDRELRFRRREQLRDRTPERLRDRTPELLRYRTPERLRDRTPERLRDRTPDRIRSSTRNRIRDRTPDSVRDKTPDGMRDRTPNQNRNELGVHVDRTEYYETGSNLSDLGTINEYLHQNTLSAIHRLEDSNFDNTSQRSNRKSKEGMNEVDEAILKLEETIRQLNTKDNDDREEKYDPILPERYSDIYNTHRRGRQQYDCGYREELNRYDSTIGDMSVQDMTRRKDYVVRYSGQIDRSMRHENDIHDEIDRVDDRFSRARKGLDYDTARMKERDRRETHERDLDRNAHILNMKQEYGDMSDQFERYERESTKLKKLQIEEERKSDLLLQHGLRLKSEIENKQRIENELLRKIADLEKQEMKLNEQRNKNELAERELANIKQQDEILAERIKLLLEKEEELSKRQRIEHVKEKAQSKTGVEHLAERKEIKHIHEEKTDQHVNQKDKEVPEKQIEIEKEKHKADTGTNNEKLFPAFKLGIPKLPDFNGKHFEQWRFEVTCLLKVGMYPDYALVHAVRNSLKGDTRQILLTLKPTASTVEILKKLEDIYGNVKTADKIIQDFYSAKQKKDETCSEWAVRLETLFQLALDKGEVEENKRDRKLKERFWRGLYSEKLKTATRVSYESSDSFELLRRKTRLEEEEEGKDTSPLKVEVQQQTKKVSEIDEKLVLLKELMEKLKSVEGDIERMKEKDKTRYDRRDHYQRGQRRYRGGYRRGYYDKSSHQKNKPEQDQNISKKEDDKSNSEDLNKETLSPRDSVKADQK